MTSEELAARVTNTINACTSGIMGVGNEQYSFGSSQKFEGYTVIEMLEEMREELRDVINYIVMFDILVQRQLDKLQENANDPRART